MKKVEVISRKVLKAGLVPELEPYNIFLQRVNEFETKEKKVVNISAIDLNNFLILYEEKI